MKILEKDFLFAVKELAEWKGWRFYHTWKSIHSPAGFPDLVLVRPPRLIFAELKCNRNRLSLKQREWLRLLEQCDSVEAYVWRPEDWESITKILD